MFSGDELLPRLIEIYRAIDSVYQAAAESGGFSCRGCDGAKCCAVDLTIHTFIESHYLKRGMESLEPSAQALVVERCRKMQEAKARDRYGPDYRDRVCVLNVSGRCSLYSFRPMICRLAGVAHHAMRPDGSMLTGPGCQRFETETALRFPDLKIDRTPYYNEMAMLEQEAVWGRRRKTKARTVSEILGDVE
jgi:hypothetical protein